MLFSATSQLLSKNSLFQFENFDEIINSPKFEEFFGKFDDLPKRLELSDAIELLVFQTKFSQIKSRLSIMIENESSFEKQKSRNSSLKLEDTKLHGKENKNHQENSQEDENSEEMFIPVELNTEGNRNLDGRGERDLMASFKDSVV